MGTCRCGFLNAFSDDDPEEKELSCYSAVVSLIIFVSLLVVAFGVSLWCARYRLRRLAARYGPNVFTHGPNDVNPISSSTDGVGGKR